MEKKNFGPCLIINCEYKDVTFYSITELVYQKCCNENMLEIYPYLEVEKQLYHLHYCKIVELNYGNIQYKRKKELKYQEKSRKRIVYEDIESRPIGEIRKKDFMDDSTTFALNIKMLTNVLYNK
ncbi:unnamed protein product [Rhizophagus irregularis]|uniref:Uncharacterized protein n=1 Tax=Rhizophagus irregularis TaxID=588596 RepID=A0A2I1HHU7_9GLOM|nr:hypothetical protein RhiirA4_480373 [Rhizophagus irregularis]CAB4436994.1 unnamed protein product [Rhizophagus irregularis]